MKNISLKLGVEKYSIKIVYSIFGFLALFFTFFSWFAFGIYSFGVIIAVLISTLIFISYEKNISIPLVEKALQREYYRIRFKFHKQEKSDNFRARIIRSYIKLLYYLIILFKSSEEAYEDIKEEVLLKYAEYIESKKNDLNFSEVRATISKLDKGEKVSAQELENLEKELHQFNRMKQKKATALSLSALFLLIMATIIIGLITSFIFPEVFKSRAASYGFVQTDWSGGASTTAVAFHNDNQSGWNYYYSKDGVSTTTNGQLSLDLTTVNRKIETASTDWQTHATTSTYYLSGSIGILQPNGTTCASAAQCSSGYCVDGYCCNSACNADCQTCNASGNEGVCTGLTVNEDGACTGVCTSCVAGTCTNRAADDTAEGCATACYDCVAGACSAVTQADDGACTSACSSCNAGVCSNSGIDSQPSGCNSTCQYCDGAGTCRNMFWQDVGSGPVGSGASCGGSYTSCKPSVYNQVRYSQYGYQGATADCNNNYCSTLSGGGNPGAQGWSIRCKY